LAWLDRLAASGEQTIHYKTAMPTPIQSLDFATYVHVLTTKWRLLINALESRTGNATIYMEGSLDHTTFFSMALQQTYTLSPLEQSTLRELSARILASIHSKYYTADLVCGTDDTIKPFIHDGIHSGYFTAELTCDDDEHNEGYDDDFITALCALANV
jgi:plasmid maintenance system antidote protein VapI